jgi:hypothetical protein
VSTPPPRLSPYAGLANDLMRLAIQRGQAEVVALEVEVITATAELQHLKGGQQ